MEKILRINLRNTNNEFKLASIIRGKDGSFYIALPNSSFAEEINNKLIVPMKFSYHTSGYHQLTAGPENDRIAKIKFGQGQSINNLKTLQGMVYFSFWDIKTINSNTTILDSANDVNEYLYTLEIDSEQYQDLTIRFLLCPKLAKGQKIKPDGSINYKELKQYQLDDVFFVVGLEDVWLGDTQSREAKK